MNIPYRTRYALKQCAIVLLILLLIAAVILAYRGKSLLTVSLAASAAVMLTEWVLVWIR